MIDLDDDGQPLDPRINFRYRADRLVSEVLGFIRCSLADGVVSPEEAQALFSWLKQNSDAAMIWPTRDLLRRLETFLSDGVLEREEQRDLQELFRLSTGAVGSYASTPSIVASSKLPLDDPPPEIEFAGRNFLFTGRFICGTRKWCSTAVAQRGGSVLTRVRKDLNVLVIGQLASRDWAHSSHGRKIELAVRYKDEGAPLAIVDEPHWLTSLESA